MSADLFGADDFATSPQCAASAIKKSLLNAGHGFAEWWASWPSGPRKTSKQACLDRWARLGCANSATLILAHLEWMKTSPDWQRDSGQFIPMPNTYLGRQGWADWTPPAPKPKTPDALAVIKAHKGSLPSQAVREKMAELRKKP